MAHEEWTAMHRPAPKQNVRENWHKVSAVIDRPGIILAMVNH